MQCHDNFPRINVPDFKGNKILVSCKNFATISKVFLISCQLSTMSHLLGLVSSVELILDNYCWTYELICKIENSCIDLQTWIAY